jgi:DNA-binding transcriptional ArsR family regulator
MGARAVRVLDPGASGAEKRALRLESVQKDIPQLDRLIHEKTRLGIVSALAASDRLSFVELKRLLDLTDGSLSVHARKLEDAGYIDCTKSFEGRMPKSEYRLTENGRAALQRYLNHMEALVEAMRGGNE